MLMDSFLVKNNFVSSVQIAVIATIFLLNLKINIGMYVSGIFMLC